MFGFPTIVAVINLREKAEREKLLQVIKIITDEQMFTANQTANMLDISASQA